jgi:hypothetical protein
VNRRQVFRGRWIRFGGYYPKYLLKLFRREHVMFDSHDLVDHHFYVPGACDRLTHDMVEANHKEDRITFWIEKHNRYAALHAREELRRRRGEAPLPIPPLLFGTPDQRTLWLKQRWYQLPLFARPVLYFVYRYFLLRGFLDGRQGLVFHFLHGLWYRFLIDVNLDELLRLPAGTNSMPQPARDDPAPASALRPAISEMGSSFPDGPRS